ncbi:hypothetical protein ACMSI9_09095 [Pseudomonas fulva]|uniref:Uncharacterized protein n=1 Tax=Pseudomonas putida TaxID=303 RepID=A0A1L7NI00_PSEPU|nr:hypothetical protein [Pseudomonas putida]BAW25121.1 Uncharacterized protein KF715C_ch45480 [Pseudomonas putida]
MINKTLHVNINEFVLSQTELDSRIEKAKKLFLRSFNSVDRFDGPAAILMPQLETLFKEGRTLSEHHKTDATFTLTVYLKKTNIAELLSDVAKQTEESYREELEALKEKNKLLLADQLFQQKKEKEAKALQAKEDKDRANALAEAEEFFANLSSEKGEQ